jgi:tetratricopeptide (TPR) repeat protein
MKSILSLLLVFGAIQPLFAQEMNCDLLAASSLDPQKTVPGVSYEKLNAAQAVPACKQAVETNPRVGRLWFQYGRALEKSNRLPDAIAAYQEAIKLNSGVANNNIGELYRDGKGFQKDYKKAEEYFTKAAELNSIEGADNLLKLKNQLKTSPLEIPKELIGVWAGKGAVCKKTQNWYGMFFTSKELRKGRVSDYNIGPDVCTPQKINGQFPQFTISFNCKPLDDEPYKTTEMFTLDGNQLQIDFNGRTVWKKCLN